MTYFEGVSVITLDLDDTLWDNGPTLNHAELTLHQWLQEHAPRLTDQYSIAGLKKHRKQLVETDPEMRHDMTRLRYTSLRLLAAETGYLEQHVLEAMQVFLQARNNVTLYDDVIPALTALSRKYKLVALSNGNADIDSIGISQFFNLAISPAQAGLSKPDPAMFFAVMDKLCVGAEEILHIGDEPATDILGAQRAGVKNIWINRHNSPWPDDLPKPGAQIACLSELI